MSFYNEYQQRFSKKPIEDRCIFIFVPHRPPTGNANVGFIRTAERRFFIKLLTLIPEKSKGW